MSNPKKEYGTTRHLGKPNYDARKARSVFDEEMQKLTTKQELSYINEKKGGFVVWMDGHKHGNEGKDNNEYKFAVALADRGYWVYLLPEDGREGSVTLRLSKKGDKTFVDAESKGLTGNVHYEQWSPTSTHKKNGILSGLQHASDKGCKILAIYDPTNVLNRKLVKLGMEKYAEDLGKPNINYIKLDGVVTYNASSKFHSWYWEDIIKK